MSEQSPKWEAVTFRGSEPREFQLKLSDRLIISVKANKSSTMPREWRATAKGALFETVGIETTGEYQQITDEQIDELKKLALRESIESMQKMIAVAQAALEQMESPPTNKGG